MSQQYVIRQAKQDDCDDLLRLVKEFTTSPGQDILGKTTLTVKGRPI